MVIAAQSSRTSESLNMYTIYGRTQKSVKDQLTNNARKTQARTYTVNASRNIQILRQKF